MLYPEDETYPPGELLPKTLAWIVREADGQRRLDVMRWGFPHQVPGKRPDTTLNKQVTKRPQLRLAHVAIDAGEPGTPLTCARHRLQRAWTRTGRRRAALLVRCAITPGLQLRRRPATCGRWCGIRVPHH
jgi:hypothetical protein